MHYLPLFNVLWSFIQIAVAQQTLAVPNDVKYGPSSVQFVSSASDFDGPKIKFNNASNFDWWYFDAVASDLSGSVVVVFYLSTVIGFPFLLPGAAVSVDVFFSFPDGTWLFLPVNDLPGTAGTATVTTNGQGASGTWANTGFSFDGSSDLSTYTINIDAPLIGVKGSLILNSIAPAHYPCGPVAAGQNMEVSPNIGWANSIPDANASADFTVGLKKVKFTGPGYHDKNWSLQPFTDNVDSWYWGHGRLGPYSIVWFDILAANGTEYISSYAALNGKIITASCSGIKVRPIGTNSQYPPVVTSGDPSGFHIDLDLGSLGVLSIDVKSTFTVSPPVQLYTRWIGSMSGGISGGPTYKGVALYEEFKFALL